MIVIGIDPGATIGVCAYDTLARRVIESQSEPVKHARYLASWVQDYQAAAIGIERARIYGKGGGQVADTIEQVGWFLAMLGAHLPQSNDAIVDCDGVYTVERRAVVKALSQAMGQQVQGDAGVWAALLTLHGGDDATRRPVEGVPGRPAEPPRLRKGSKTQWTKGKPEVPAIPAVEAGPLYGVSSHARAALAVAWTLAKHLGQ